MSPARIGGKPAPRTKKEAKTAAITKKEDANGGVVIAAVSSDVQADFADVAPTTLPSDVQANYTSLAPQMVPLDMIVRSLSQPRRYFDTRAMESLVTSVKKDGILQPVLLRPLGDNYELVAGERRYLAAQSAGLIEVPAVIRSLSDAQAIECANAENLQREDLNPVEETEAILDLLALKLETKREGVITLLNKLSNIQRKKTTDSDVRPEDKNIIEEVFKSIGKISSEAFRVHRLPLLKLPEDILEALRAGKIEYTKAREIAKLESLEDRTQLLSDAIEMSLSLSEVRKQVLALKPKPESHQLQSRLDTAYKQAKKSKVWEQPSQREKLESLLAELEALLSTEAN